MHQHMLLAQRSKVEPHQVFELDLGWLLQKLHVSDKSHWMVLQCMEAS